MRMGSLYFASDKAIFDALTQRSLTGAELRKVFLSRGIVISNESDKKFLASRFSALFHDYYDYRNLSLLVGGAMAVRKPPTLSSPLRFPKTN